MNKILTATLLLLISSTANSALLSRLGGLAFYDTDSNLTWLADANAVAGTIYDSNLFSGSSTDGATTWANANLWAANLDVAGVTGWRLPTADPGCGSFNCTNSELGNLYYNVFGGVGGSSTSDYEALKNNNNYLLFSNISEYRYWTATEHSDTRAYSFWFVNGHQGNHWKLNERHVWAVKTGDVSAIPVPAAAWLFGSGLLWLLAVARRK